MGLSSDMGPTMINISTKEAKRLAFKAETDRLMAAWEQVWLDERAAIAARKANGDDINVYPWPVSPEQREIEREAEASGVTLSTFLQGRY